MSRISRIALLVLLVGGGVVGWQTWRRGGIPGFLETDRAAETRRVREELAALSLPDRRALIRVLDQSVDPVTRRYRTRVVWEELTADGEGRYEPREIELAGRQPRFEALVMTFSAEARRDPLAGKSLLLFRRAYGEHTAPEAGYSFADPEHPVPPSYRVSETPSEVERELWRGFWGFATDPAAARAEGIEVVQCKAVSTELVPGKSYLITASDSGQLDLRGPFDTPPR
ncbi:MAG: hypothetical protein R3F20_11935 [Planctomycetota bacterium]